MHEKNLWLPVSLSNSNRESVANANDFEFGIGVKGGGVMHAAFTHADDDNSVLVAHKSIELTIYLTRKQNANRGADAAHDHERREHDKSSQHTALPTFQFHPSPTEPSEWNATDEFNKSDAKIREGNARRN
jgi:hypothetical protein